MSSVVGVPPVVVCSDSEHRQQVQVAAAVDVESPPPVLQLRRRSANYQPTTWDYDSIISSLSRRPLPLGASEETEEEEAADDDDDANLLQVVVRTTSVYVFLRFQSLRLDFISMSSCLVCVMYCVLNICRSLMATQIVCIILAARRSWSKSKQASRTASGDCCWCSKRRTTTTEAG